METAEREADEEERREKGKEEEEEEGEEGEKEEEEGEVTSEFEASTGEEEKRNNGEPAVCFIHSPGLLEMADRNPRYTGRAAMVFSLIEAFDLLNKMTVVTSLPASRKELLSFHSRDYIHFLETHSNRSDSEEEEEEEEAADREMYGLGFDCPMFPGLYDYTCAVGGASLTAADLIAKGEAKTVINWYGGWHHAHRDQAAGFCYCNDIVLCLLRLLDRFSRLLYVDMDIHHGDGVEEAFWLSPRVMTVSFHSFSPGFFPGTGDVHSTGGGRGKYYTVNIPLGGGVGDQHYFSIFTRVLSEVKGRFQPECVVMQCGADVLSGDPLGNFNLTPTGASLCVRHMLQWRLPTILLGGGGYNFPNTARFWALCTALAVDRQLTNQIPEHKYFPQYGPGFELSVAPGNQRDRNTVDEVYKLLSTITSHLHTLTPHTSHLTSSHPNLAECK